MFVTSTAKKILDQALSLPREEREELVGALSNSLEPVAWSPEWEAELARRVQKIQRGDAVFHDAQNHLDELRAKYHG